MEPSVRSEERRRIFAVATREGRGAGRRIGVRKAGEGEGRLWGAEVRAEARAERVGVAIS